MNQSHSAQSQHQQQRSQPIMPELDEAPIANNNNNNNNNINQNVNNNANAPNANLPAAPFVPAWVCIAVSINFHSWFGIYCPFFDCSLSAYVL
jgi:hypothetical protein